VRHEFLPAIGPYVTDVRKKAPWRHPIHWLDRAEQAAKIYYPYALISHALWRDQDLTFPKEGVTLFGDSGGYTVVTQPGYSTSPELVIRWQLQNCTRGVMLDIPPYRPGSAIQFRGSAADWWEPSMILSLRNVARALPYYDDAKRVHKMRTDEGLDPPDYFKWWGVVQGEEREQMNEWHSRISEVYPFDAPGEGWALAPKPSTDLLSCTRYLRFAHETGLRRVHFLQVTADRTVALVLALAQLSGTIDLVTYDSASALRCAINRSAILQKGFGQEYIKEETAAGETAVGDYMMNVCQCQACLWYKEDFPLSNSEYPHYILLHNHIAMQASFDLT
jgi:hypothetical protein